MIDAEVRHLLDTCYQRSVKILEENREKLEMMKDALMEYETIDADQIDDIMEGRKPRPPKSWTDTGSGPSAPAEASRDMAKDDDDSVGDPASEQS